jgi:hypothetical protein
MESSLARKSQGLVLRVGSVCLVSLLPAASSVRPEFCCDSMRVPQVASAASLSAYPCLRSWASTNHNKRSVVLHGLDWALETSVRPSCFPEREVVFAFEENKGLVPHPFTSRIKLWVTNKHDVTEIQILESSASSTQQEMTAIGFVTNHKCNERNSKNCSVKGGAVFVRID